MSILAFKDLFAKKEKPIRIVYNKRCNSPIYQLIALSIREEAKNNVILGKRGDDIFICYKSEELAKFFRDWFGIQKLRRDKQMSNDMYSAFIQSALQLTESELIDLQTENKSEAVSQENMNGYV
jgi:hypothetical protein